MWEVDHNKGWELKNWCLQIVVLKKTLESPLDYKIIKPANPQGNQPWIFIGRTGAEAEAITVCPPDAKSFRKRPLCWERLRAGVKGGDKGQDGWMSSLTQLTWAWANSGIWWRTGKPGILQSMGSQRVWHKIMTKEQWSTVLVSKYKNEITRSMTSRHL